MPSKPRQLAVAAALCLALASAPSHALPEWCGKAGAWLVGLALGRGAEREYPAMAAADRAVFLEWAAAYDGLDPGLYCQHFAPELWALTWSGLPDSIFAFLLDQPGRPGRDWSETFGGRMAALGTPVFRYGPLEAIAFEARAHAGDTGERFRADLAGRVAAIRALPGPELRALRDAFRVRRAVLEAKERLARHHTAEYRLRFEGTEVVTPDGKRLAYRRPWGGGIEIRVRYGDILPTQVYQSTEKVTGYVLSGGLGAGGFEELLGPDGRIHLFDQHHRTRAFVQRNVRAGQAVEDVVLPFRLYPADDGHYYTLPHWAVLGSGNFPLLPRAPRRGWRNDPDWSFLAPDERDRVVETSRTSAIEAIRDIYYRETGLSRP